MGAVYLALLLVGMKANKAIQNYIGKKLQKYPKIAKVLQLALGIPLSFVQVLFISIAVLRTSEYLREKGAGKVYNDLKAMIDGYKSQVNTPKAGLIGEK